MREFSIEAGLIKKFLDTCPKVPLSDMPLFKLVWSDDERELRLGTFCDFDVHGNKIREYNATENCLKYEWIKERWILEMWSSPEASLNPELPNSRFGSYEPIYVFDKQGIELPLNLQVVQYIVKKCLEPKKSKMYRDSLYKENQERKEKESQKRDLDVLMDEGPLVSQFHDGSAILLPGKDFKF